MFEAEVEMEKRNSSVGPLLLLVCLVGGIVGSIAYYLYQSNHGPTPAQASAAVTEYLNNKGPVVVHFHSGTLRSIDGDPHYRLLEKLGVLSLKAAKDGSAQVTVNEDALKPVAGLSTFRKLQNPDGTTAYIVPLADRKPAEISRVQMVNPTMAEVNFSWKWQTTPIGESFEASGPLVKSFNQWDRSALIEKFGADFYHGPARTDSLKLIRSGQDWRIAID